LQAPAKKDADGELPLTLPQSPSVPCGIDIMAEDVPARLASIMNQLVDRHKDDPVAAQELSLAAEDLLCKLMARTDTRAEHKVVKPQTAIVTPAARHLLQK